MVRGEGADQHTPADSDSAGSSDSLRGRPVLLGEVLFDRFPDGSRVLGGAPFNVAWHLEVLGLRPLVITRVGDDALGREILDAMRSWGLDTSGVQIDRQHATGRVDVSLEGGEPSFEIRPGQAWDFIDASAAMAALENHELALIYHGSLATRGDVSRHSVDVLRSQIAAATFIDVNLRDPWWDAPQVWSLIRGATWLKLNSDELSRLGAGGSTESAARSLLEDNDVQAVVVTQGADGALIVERDATSAARPTSTTEAVDTVGAGDALSAVMIAGLLGGRPIHRTLEMAVRFAARLCGIRGAVPSDRAIYRELLEDDWGAGDD